VLEQGTSLNIFAKAKLLKELNASCSYLMEHALTPYGNGI
jgi:hypothetical protein